jgi:hypothetical protein
MLIALYDIQNRISRNIEDLPKRYLYHEINYNQRFIGIVGARGVGKTTVILQYLKENYNNPALALYVSADNIHVNAIGLSEIVEEHHRNGGNVIAIDEIHKLKNWAQEVKSIYDSYPEMRIIISGSSAFQIKTQGYDLSRRLVYYTLQGLSFREFILFKTGHASSALSINDILEKHTEIATEINNNINVFPLFREYIQSGYYPFWQEGKDEYPIKIENIINKILYEDIPSAYPIKYDAIRQLKRFLYIVATSNPFQINVTELARELHITRVSLYEYLDFLDQSFVIHRFWKNSRGKAFQRKPEKLFLSNTNIIHYLQPQAFLHNKGLMRETFFANQFSSKNKLYTAPKADFEDSNNNQFEIGGKSKKSNQLDSHTNGYLVLDDITIGVGNKIPLYLFGYLY